jgi:hypothetical protein
MAGCGGGHDDDGGGVDAALSPRVRSVWPDDGQVGVEPSWEITARFSEDMDATTINSSTFLVMEGANPVPGTITYDAENRAATFDPDDRLALLGQYAVIVTREVRSTAGLRPWEEFHSGFEVRDGAWTTPTSIDAPFGSALRPVVASDTHGNAIAVWDQFVFDPAPDVFANRYTPGPAGWGLAESLNNSPSSTSALDGAPDVVIDSEGVATVGFRDPSPTTRPAARRYVPGVGWEAPAMLHDVDGNVVNLQLAVDPARVVTAVWLSGADVLANRYIPGTGWSASATPIDNVDGSTGPLVETGADSLGRVIALWTQSDGTRPSVYWNRTDSSGTWGTAALLETDDTATAGFVHLAVAPDGRAIAVYWLTSSGGSQFYAKMFDGTNWGSETPLPGSTSGRGSLAWAPDGTAWFVYESFFDGGPTDIVVRRYSASTGWSSPESIETDEMENVVQPQLAIDRRGNVFVAWRDGSNVWANRFRPGVGWGTATEVQDNDLRAAFVPAISVGGDGEAVLVWELSNSETSIYGSVFR